MIPKLAYLSRTQSLLNSFTIIIFILAGFSSVTECKSSMLSRLREISPLLCDEEV